MCTKSNDHKEFNLPKPIGITNMYEKNEGTYKNLPLEHALLTPDILSFADEVEEILYIKTQLNPFANRIDFSIDEGMINKFNLPFDSFNISLYRNGMELNIRDYTSNYIYTEYDYDRNLWIDLYYYPEYYDSDLVFKDIIREINNFMNRDFDKYLNEEYDKNRNNK